MFMEDFPFKKTEVARNTHKETNLNFSSVTRIKTVERSPMTSRKYYGHFCCVAAMLASKAALHTNHAGRLARYTTELTSTVMQLFFFLQARTLSEALLEWLTAVVQTRVMSETTKVYVETIPCSTDWSFLTGFRTTRAKHGVGTTFWISLASVMLSHGSDHMNGYSQHSSSNMQTLHACPSEIFMEIPLHLYLQTKFQTFWLYFPWNFILYAANS